jgi:hypothetical protein
MADTEVKLSTLRAQPKRRRIDTRTTISAKRVAAKKAGAR